VEVILNWLIVPKIIDVPLIKIRILMGLFFIIIIKGAIFTQVNIKAKLFHEIFKDIGGNQVWKGAAAILIARAMRIMMSGMEKSIFI